MRSSIYPLNTDRTQASVGSKILIFISIICCRGTSDEKIDFFRIVTKWQEGFDVLKDKGPFPYYVSIFIDLHRVE